MRAYWLEAQSIEDREVLAQIAIASGLDRNAFLAALTDPALEQEVLNDIAWAHNNGISGVPALVFQEKYLVSGAQPYDVLTRVVDQIRAEEPKAA
jgi:predicted DsbA family dithiol-disulfide isomerase